MNAIDSQGLERDFSEKPASPFSHPALAKAAGVMMVCVIGGWGSIVRADELQPLRNIGDGYKAVRIITRYELNAADKTMDLYASEANDPSLTQEVRKQLAGQTARDICANRTFKPGWTVRIFLPNESAPAASCNGGAPHGGMRHPR